MPVLPKFTLHHDEKKEDWALERDSNGQVVKRFPTKADATAGGALRQAVGGTGSVKLQEAERAVPGGAHLPPKC